MRRVSAGVDGMAAVAAFCLAFQAQHRGRHCGSRGLVSGAGAVARFSNALGRTPKDDQSYGGDETDLWTMGVIVGLALVTVLARAFFYQQPAVADAALGSAWLAIRAYCRAVGGGAARGGDRGA